MRCAATSVPTRRPLQAAGDRAGRTGGSGEDGRPLAEDRRCAGSTASRLAVVGRGVPPDRRDGPARRRSAGAAGPTAGRGSCTGPPPAFSDRVTRGRWSRSIARRAMGSRFGDSSLLAAARDAIAPDAARYQKVVAFGYVEFPGSGNSCSPQPGCCASTASPPIVNFADVRPRAARLRQIRRPPARSRAATSGPRRPPSMAARWFSRGDRTAGGATSCWSATAGRTAARARTPAAWTRRRRRPAGGNDVSTIVVAPGQLDPDTADCLSGIAVYGGAQKPALLPSGVEPDRADRRDRRHHARDGHGTLASWILTTPIQNPDRAAVFWNDIQIPRTARAPRAGN